jgi:hypothetical protein
VVMAFSILAYGRWMAFVSVGAYPMPDIMIRCPTLKEPVSTGLTTEAIKFESLDDLSIPLRCPACRKTHHWGLKDAWVKKE